VVSVVAVTLTANSLAAVRHPPKGSAQLPAETTTVKPGALPNEHSSHGGSAREQRPQKVRDREAKCPVPAQETAATVLDRLCGLVVRVPGYRSRGPGSISGAIRFSEK
jgi:hypothetical protein